MWKVGNQGAAGPGVSGRVLQGGAERVRGPGAGGGSREEDGVCAWVIDCASRLQAVARDEARKTLRGLIHQLQILGKPQFQTLLPLLCSWIPFFYPQYRHVSADKGDRHPLTQSALALLLLLVQTHWLQTKWRKL